MEKFQQFEQKMMQLTENPRIVNNDLQIVCVGQNDNYLDMLTEQFDDFDKELEYIKCFALSSLIGDCKLIERIYIGDQQNSIKYVNK